MRILRCLERILLHDEMRNENLRKYMKVAKIIDLYSKRNHAKWIRHEKRKTFYKERTIPRRAEETKIEAAGRDSEDMETVGAEDKWNDSVQQNKIPGGRPDTELEQSQTEEFRDET